MPLALVREPGEGAGTDLFPVRQGEHQGGFQDSAAAAVPYHSPVIQMAEEMRGRPPYGRSRQGTVACGQCRGMVRSPLRGRHDFVPS
ncbi:hypothetical protein GCM10022267_31350 [Lentzea roselyniae]|uniref:Uncharacterized protein n=1 Tax=Lentzea roselyniae TaxID=531940 RepID=A0ABP7AYB9_9PSEU